MIITHEYWLNGNGGISVRVLVAGDDDKEKEFRGLFWMTPEEWEQWKTWQTLAAATYAMTRADMAGGIDIQVHFLVITNYAPSTVSPRGVVQSLMAPRHQGH